MGMTIIIALVTFVVGGLLVWFVMRVLMKSRYDAVIREAEKESEVMKQKKLLEVKEKFLHLKADLEKQVSARNSKIQSVEAKLKQRELNLNQRQEDLQRKNSEVDAVKENLAAQLELVDKKKQDLEKLHQREIEHLETLSGLSAEEAKERLIESLKDEAKSEATSYINEIMEEAKMTANKEAKKIVIQSIQRVATETAIENSITVFHIESDEIKGRIIGREGRNIRALETLTGIDLIIDDTPEAVILSGFDPIRREIARIALEKLIVDGRVHPSRIEEMVEKAKKEVEVTIREEGEAATFDTGVNGLHPELVRLLGKLKYRTSYGQNVLKHSIEVSHLAGLMAAELGVDVNMAKRAGLLHDIGKSVDHEMEGSHVSIGVGLLKRYKENHTVINAVEAHHGDVEPQSIIAVLVQAADAISAARPGARRETLESYIKRLQKLEEIADNFRGVEKSFAIQAGRELRIVIVPEDVSDDGMTLLARDIAKKIEEELEYPGQIKVNLIRETRAVEYAK